MFWQRYTKIIRCARDFRMQALQIEIFQIKLAQIQPFLYLFSVKYYARGDSLHKNKELDEISHWK